MQYFIREYLYERRAINTTNRNEQVLDFNLVDHSTTQNELLQYMMENNIIDLAYVQAQMKMKKREEILKNHIFSIWYSESEKRWYTHLPDETKIDGRKKIKRKKKSDLEKAICDYYKLLEKNQESLRRQKDKTFEEVFYEFMRYKTKIVMGGTIKRMMADWKRFYNPNQEFVHKEITAITKIDIDDFLNTQLDEHKLKKTAFGNMCGILKQTLEYAVDAEYIEKSPYRVKVNRKKIVSSSKKPSDKEVYRTNEKELFLAEMERRLHNNPSNTAPLAIMLDFELGTRKGEILAISKSDIVNGRIHIHRQLVEDWDTTDIDNIKSKGFIPVEYTKSADGDRWLPLTKRAKDLIARVEKINEEYGHSYKDFLFVKEGKNMSPDAIDCQVKRGCEYIGMSVKTMHKIRKTYGSMLYHRGVNISAVKEMLGHADESTTLKYYIYNTDDDLETEKQVLDALEGMDTNESDQSDQNIIRFPRNKKAENIENTTFSAL